MKVLIVEDEAILAMSLSTELEELGLQVCGCVSCGADALHEYTRLQPDIIFMDIFLEGDINGIEAARQIREYNFVPIIFVTASTDTTTLRAIDEIAGSRLLKKPYTSDDLTRIVAAV